MTPMTVLRLKMCGDAYEDSEINHRCCGFGKM